MKNANRFVVMEGDGIGSEQWSQVAKLLGRIERATGQAFDIIVPPYGRAAVGRYGTMLREEDVQAMQDADAVLFLPTGAPEYDPAYDDLPTAIRKTGSALRLRKSLGLFCNVRPIKPFAALTAASPLKDTVAADVDFVIVRELLGGLYFGEPRGIEVLPDGDRRGVNTHVYLASQIRAIAAMAFETARIRKGRVCSVEKAAVMEAGQLWREEVTALHSQYPDVDLTHMAVDTCAQHIVQRPRDFDVIVTDNVFGDILSDCAAPILGSIGLQAGACFGPPRDNGTRLGFYEPADVGNFHLAGKNMCNPLAAILSFAMALEHSFAMPHEAGLVVKAVGAALERGVLTYDLTDGPAASTHEMGDAVAQELDRLIP